MRRLPVVRSPHTLSLSLSLSLSLGAFPSSLSGPFYLFTGAWIGEGEAMEGDKLRGSRVFCGKKPSLSAMRSSNPCSGGEESTWEYFPCPFCYVDVEVPVLSSHLQEEHCFDTRNTVCPLCAANEGKDLIGHFSIHHSHMLKRRKPQRTSSQTIGNDPHEVNAYYGALLTNSRRIILDPVPDTLLSSFICNLSFSDTKDEVKESNKSIASSELVSSQEQWSASPTCSEAMTQNYEERSCRAEFVQQLIFSTML